MRKEEQVFKQILNFANDCERIRVVMLNGSRLNFNAPRDIMQDYDVVFFITEIKDLRYKIDREWINRFGELVIFQQNDFEDGSYIFLMQFKDGVRIDLSFKDIKVVEQAVKEDTLSRILLDKDKIVPELELPNDSLYYVKKPTEKEFDKLLNEAWWIQTYVAKGIWRDELPLAKYMFDVILIECIKQLLFWEIGRSNNWEVNVGKCGKWLKHFLPKEVYNEFISLYPVIEYDEMWKSLFRTGKFIQKVGGDLALKLGYKYPTRDVINVTEYLRNIKALPKGAEDF
jgi:aminoglycoside 6-adenylyltransferase